MAFTSLIAIQFFRRKGYYIDTTKHKGVFMMSPRQKILAIRLSEKLAKNPDYAKSVGVEIKSKKKSDKKG